VGEKEEQGELWKNFSASTLFNRFLFGRQ